MISNKDIKNYYESLQEKNEKNQEQRKQEIYNKIPSVKKTDQQIQALGIQISRSALAQDKNIDQYKAQLKDLQSKRIQMLLRNNYPEDYLDLKHNCAKCQDTGVLDAGKRCNCYEEMLEKRG